MISGLPDLRRNSLSIGYDRIIESCIPVPGALTIDSSDTETPDIRVRLLPAEPASFPPQPLYRFEGGTLTFSAPEIATYRCNPCEIAVTPLDGASFEDVIDLLIATALPALLWMRGGFVLHASGVVLPGQTGAIAIAGPSGIGKSSLLAELQAIGAASVGDDTLDVRITEGKPTISGLAAGYFRSDAGNERRIFHATRNPQRRAQLNSIVILTHAPQMPEINRLSGMMALEQILMNRHRPKIPDLLGQRASLLRMSAALANSIPVFMWRRPRNSPHLGQAEVRMLLDSIAM